MLKTDRERCSVLVAACAGLVTLLTGLIEPYMPVRSNLLPSSLPLTTALSDVHCPRDRMHCRMEPAVRTSGLWKAFRPASWGMHAAQQPL